MRLRRLRSKIPLLTIIDISPCSVTLCAYYLNLSSSCLNELRSFRSSPSHEGFAGTKLGREARWARWARWATNMIHKTSGLAHFLKFDLDYEKSNIKVAIPLNVNIVNLTVNKVPFISFMNPTSERGMFEHPSKCNFIICAITERRASQYKKDEQKVDFRRQTKPDWSFPSFLFPTSTANFGLHAGFLSIIQK